MEQDKDGGERNGAPLFQPHFTASGNLACQLPLTFGLSLGLLFFFLTLSYLLWALSSQHKIEPWFPSLALPALHHDLSTMPVSGTPTRKHHHHTGFLSLFPLLPSPKHLPSPNIYHAPSIPPRRRGVDGSEELNQDQGLFCKAWSYKEMAGFRGPIPAFWRKQRTKTWEPLGEQRGPRLGVQRERMWGRGTVSASLPVRVSSPEAAGLSLECPPGAR